MRQLKFRVWDKLEKRFIHSDKGYQGHFILTLNGKFQNLQNGSGGDDYVVHQFTGLKDDNNKEIYEGDIIFCKIHYGIENRIGIVEYFGSSFIINWRNQTDDPLDDVEDIGVIGNIFENKELL